jgi:hypothetical protein
MRTRKHIAAAAIAGLAILSVIPALAADEETVADPAVKALTMPVSEIGAGAEFLVGDASRFDK